MFEINLTLPCILSTVIYHLSMTIICLTTISEDSLNEKNKHTLSDWGIIPRLRNFRFIIGINAEEALINCSTVT